MPELTSVWQSNTLYVLLGGLVGVLILVWDLRGLIPGLVITQFGVGQIMVHRYGLAPRWALILLAGTTVACMILAITAGQRGFHPRTRPMPRLFRGLLLALVGGFVYAVGLSSHLPLVDESTARFLVWLALAGFLVLALSEDPLYVAVGLILWILPGQAFLAVALPIPVISFLLGSLILVTVLACCYLALAADVTLALQSRPLTDPIFPESFAPRQVNATPHRRTPAHPTGEGLAWHWQRLRLSLRRGLR